MVAVWREHRPRPSSKMSLNFNSGSCLVCISLRPHSALDFFSAPSRSTCSSVFTFTVCAPHWPPPLPPPHLDPHPSSPHNTPPTPPHPSPSFHVSLPTTIIDFSSRCAPFYSQLSRPIPLSSICRFLMHPLSSFLLIPISPYTSRTPQSK